MSEFTPPGGEPPRPQPEPDPWRGGAPPLGGPSPYHNRAEEFSRAQTSRKMAGWGLGLSFVWCLHPLTLLVSAGLAIAALARSGDGQDHGRRMAVGALIINALWVLVVVVLVVTGVVNEFTEDADRDDEGRVTERSGISAFKLRVGDCLNDPTLTELEFDETSEVVGLEAVPCSEPHDLEVYHRFELPNGDYPGEERVVEEADRACSRELEPFTGRIGRRSDLTSAYYYPQEATWRLLDDREVVCVVGRAERKTSGTLRGVGR